MKQNEALPDNKMATDIADTIQCITTIPNESLIVTVDGGWVCLQGTLAERHQKEFVEEVVRHLKGVRGVTNLISVDQQKASRSLEAFIH